jgi:N utilization substance protein B
MIRSEAREKAFIIIFQKSINDEPIDALITMSEESDGIKVNQFATDLINGVYNNIDDIDKNIEKKLRDWTMGRISKTALAVLRLAAYEVLYSDDTPDGVAANEAVELAKKYCGDDEPAFINGIIGSIINSKS